MTVARVVGTCNGASVVFTKDSDGNWDVAVPADMTGQYVVSVTAYDEAGNSTYRALMLFTVDVETLEVRIIPLHFAYRVEQESFDAIPIQSNYAYAVASERFTYRVMPLHFRTVVEGDSA